MVKVVLSREKLRNGAVVVSAQIAVLLIGWVGLATIAFSQGVSPAALVAAVDEPSSVGQSSGEQPSKWQFRIAPYGWATAIKGKTGVRRVVSDVDVGISDVVKHVEGGLMVVFEARHDRWGINTDFIYAALSDSSPNPRGVVFTKAKVDLDEIIWTQTLAYTVMRDEGGTVDVLGGFRLMSINLDLGLDGGALPSGAPVDSRDLSAERTWIDPVIGARGRMPVSPDTFLLAMGDIGGFGASSQLTWQALAAFGYEVSNATSLALGYRALGYNHNRDNFRNDLIMFGPFLGAEFKF